MKRSSSSGFTHHRSDLSRRLGQHANLVFAENPGFDGLHYENALQNSAIDQRNTQERLVGILARIAEVLEAGMVFHLLYGDRPHQFCHQAGEPS